MTENTQIEPLSSPSEENNRSEVSISEIINIVKNTDIDSKKITSYIDPKETPIQSLEKTMNSSMRTLFEKTRQKIKNVPAYRFAPQAMEIWGEMVRLGVAAKYIMDVSKEKYSPGEKTYPFSEGGWDISEEKVKEISKEVEGQIDTAKAVLDGKDIDLPKDEIEAMPLIMAMCHLKTEPLFVA